MATDAPKKPTSDATMSSPDEVTGWADVPPEFGSAMPYGSCNAILGNGTVCGWPRRQSGFCLKGHRRDG